MTTPTLRAAAQAVLNRWDSPQWQWAWQSPTADLMRDLREALAAAPAQQPAQPLTEAQIDAMRRAAADQGLTGIAPSLHLARAVEAWHGIGATQAPTTDKEM